MDSLALGMMKHSGPSPGGGGHRSRKEGRMLVQNKDSVHVQERDAKTLGAQAANQSVPGLLLHSI